MSKDERLETVRGYTYKYSNDWTKNLETERHWRLYWYQQNVIQDYMEQGDSILEIGVGSGFTANYLKSRGFKVTTLDIDERKNPDIVANLVDYKFQENYDHILAFEVFEHIPINEVEKIINQLSTICTKNMFISVPRNEIVLLRLETRLPLIGTKMFEITLKRRKIAIPYHCWEIDHNGLTTSKFRTFLSKAGFNTINIFKKWSIFFFVLKPTTDKPTL
jgi:uncharacterized UPF0146 family protein